MKKIAILFLFCLTILSCKKEENTQNNNKAAKELKENKSVAESKKATMKIEGMTCAIGCAKTIENKLAELEGVSNAKVDFDSKTASIEYDGAIQSLETLSKTVEGVADGKTYKVKEAKNI